MLRKLSSLSIVLPCHNEAESVARVVADAFLHGSEYASALEVVVVDDGSTDGTCAQVGSLQQVYRSLRLMRHSRQRGYGAALQTGFRACNHDYVFYTDGDGQFDVRELQRLVALIDRYDIVSGYRLIRQDSWLRRFNGRVWSWLSGSVLGFSLRDVNCAFKLFPRVLFDRIDMRSRGAAIDSEILYKAMKEGFTIGQVGVSHFGRRTGTQSGARPGVIALALFELLRLGTVKTRSWSSDPAQPGPSRQNS